MQAQINPRKNLKCWEFFFCLGAVSPPSNRTSLIFAPGATAKIVWSFNDEIQSLSRRTWSLIFPDGRLPTVVLAILDGDDDHRIQTSLFDVEVEKPATLVLKNVNQTYNGTYQFSLLPSIGAASSEVVVFIAGKFFYYYK